MGNNRRRYFTTDELAKLISAARKGRYGQRDATLILLMARHGLRVSEAIDLEWDQIRLRQRASARSKAQGWDHKRASNPRRRASGAT